jgi:hypothetical protein
LSAAIDVAVITGTLPAIPRREPYDFDLGQAMALWLSVILELL